MQLDRLTVALRPRTDWEAIDLGLRLAQRHASILFPIWVMTSVPWALSILLVGITTDHIGLALLVLWVIKPLFERPLLHVLSRVVFGDEPARREWWRIALRQPFVAGAFGAITWRRLSPARAFNLPVQQLEKLAGGARRKRLQVLHANTGSAAMALTGLTFCLFIVGSVTLFYVALSLASGQLVGVETQPFDGVLVTVTERLDEAGVFWDIVAYGVVWLVDGLLTPFYVAAGFSLYLNRRTHLEAWDVELMFRNMVLRRASAILILAVSIGLIGPPDAIADNLEGERDARRSQIEQILDDDDFGRPRTVTRWTAKNKDDESLETDTGDLDALDLDESSALLNWITRVGSAAAETVVWLIFAAFLLVIYRFRSRWLPYFARAATTARPAAPTSGGLLLKREELPDDVPAQVRALWESGARRDALSLLYRATLTALNEQHQLGLDSSATEGDCERVVAHRLSGDRATYFKEINRVWQSLAYAHRSPQTAQVMTLCSQFGLIDPQGAAA
ncbi:MAG: hypothetical protein AAF610_07480 [Pseudomonadota bacterium]